MAVTRVRSKRVDDEYWGNDDRVGDDRVGKDRDSADDRVNDDHVDDDNDRVDGDPLDDEDWVSDQRVDDKDLAFHRPCWRQRISRQQQLGELQHLNWRLSGGRQNPG